MMNMRRKKLTYHPVHFHIFPNPIEMGIDVMCAFTMSNVSISNLKLRFLISNFVTEC